MNRVQKALALLRQAFSHAQKAGKTRRAARIQKAEDALTRKPKPKPAPSRFAGATKYPGADSRTQWFQDKYPGAPMHTNVLVLHTTETSGWPDYLGGSEAPNYTAHPLIKAQKTEWRQHFPDNRSARALVNSPGGVETNTLNCVQVELIGTCDPAHRLKWGTLKAGVDYIYWPEAPEWALRGLADFVAYCHVVHGVRLEAPVFKPYPASYGANGVRFTGRQWENFYGVCGHQHVPENDHGDPGALPIDQVFKYATEEKP